MSSFHDNFTVNAEFPNWHEWETEKPLLKNAAVRFAPPYVNESSPSSKLEVTALVENEREFGSFHEIAWHFITRNAEDVERALRRKLLLNHAYALRMFNLELLPDYEDDELEEWHAACRGINMDTSDAIDSLYELTSIGLLDDGLDECGFSYFDFSSGWDEEHGFSILMHRNSVLAAGGGSEFSNRGPQLLPHVRYIQSYRLEDGDLSLLDK